MSDEDSSVLATIKDAVGLVPEPVQNTFFKALSRLLGGAMSIPAAKFKQFTQGIDDTTTARSTLSLALAKAASDKVINDPLVVQAAVEVLLPDAIQKLTNRARVAEQAAEYLTQIDATSASNEQGSAPDVDWMNSFIRFAEDASSERLQDLFGRILAGEAARPGAFGLATLRAVSELDQSIANDFLYAWSQSVGDAIDYSTEWQRGEGFMRWKRLSEAGLLAIQDSVQYLPPYREFGQKYSLWSPMQVGPTYITVYFEKGCSAQWHQIDFTRIGRELGALLDKPDYAKNMRQAALRLPVPGILRIDLNTASTPSEVIWQEHN